MQLLLFTPAYIFDNTVKRSVTTRYIIKYCINKTNTDCLCLTFKKRYKSERSYRRQWTLDMFFFSRKLGMYTAKDTGFASPFRIAH